MRPFDHLKNSSSQLNCFEAIHEVLLALSVRVSDRVVDILFSVKLVRHSSL